MPVDCRYTFDRAKLTAMPPVPIQSKFYGDHRYPRRDMSLFPSHPALKAVPAAVALVLVSGCASITPVQKQTSPDEFLSSGVYAQGFPGLPAESCEAARRALLSQGYVIGEAGETQVRGRKYFQPESDAHVQIEFHVTCAPNSKGSNSTTVFANAVRERYSLRKSSSSASLGVGAIGSISLPFSSSDDALVKVGSETIPTQGFYAQFFELVDRYLDAEELAAESEDPAPDQK